MPRRPSVELPAEVRFANWEKYQDHRTSQWVRLWNSAAYDQRIGHTDLARSLFLTGIIQAGIGHGKVTVRAWLGHHTDKKRARFQIKSWLDNGLLIGCSAQIDREIDRELPSAAVASAELKPAKPKRPPAAPKPEATTLPLRRPSWLEPYCVAWEARFDSGSFAGVAGQCAKHLKPLHDAHGPEAVSAALARYLAATEPQYVSLPHFVRTFASWTGAGSRADPLELPRKVMARYGGPLYTPAEAWNDFDDATRAAIKQAGGLAAIWNGAKANGRPA